MRMITRRTALYVVTAIVAITVNFFIPRLMPGNPALTVLGRVQAEESKQAIAALELHWSGARVTLVHRGDAISSKVKYWIKPNIENRIKNGEISAYFRSTIERIHETSVTVRSPDGPVELANDFVFALTGYRPDIQFLERHGIRFDPATLRPYTNPETLESDRKGMYLAGVLVAGMHTNEIFIENGRFHGKRIAEAIAGELA